MSLAELGLLLVSVCSSLLGQFFLKSGALKLGAVTLENLVMRIFGAITNLDVLIGLLFYGLGALAYILLLTRVNLSVVAPSASLVYVFSVLVGYFAFDEVIPLHRVVGIGLVICGVILIVWQR